MARGGFSKGTANVSPSDVEKLKPLLAHFNSKGPKFFTNCFNSRGVTKAFPNPERRKQVCAVLKDVSRGTTGWRRGNQKKG